MVAEFLEQIKGKNITIWGLGLNRGGVESAKFFIENGARVKIVDTKSEEDLAASVDELKGYPNVSFVFGRQKEEDFEDADVIIKNPAVPWKGELAQKLLAKGKKIETDIILFFNNFPGTIVGITGTKGKTTTATLIASFLQEESRKVFLGGNLKVSLFSFMKGGYLDHFEKENAAVLELSSFQLEDLKTIQKSPNISLITNIYRDHLDRYEDMEQYVSAKKNIYLYQSKEDTLSLNFDHDKVKELSKEGRGRLLWFSASSSTFDQGVFLKEGKAFWKEGSKEEEIVAIPERFLNNPYMLQNILASLSVAYGVLKVRKKAIKKVVDSFPGVPYRLEMIGKANQTSFYNDTSATIPEAAMGNILSFSRLPVLITGGADKNLSFVKFGEIIVKKTKAAVLLPGTATDKIKEAILTNDSNFQIIEVEDMEEAVKKAYDLAGSNGIVLLSPGCASFGLFRNEFDRGDQFNEAVGKLSGQPA